LKKLDALYHEMHKCARCPEGLICSNKKDSKGMNKLEGWGEPGGVLFVGMNPSKCRYPGNKIWDNERYSFFLEMLNEMNYDNVPLFFTNLVKCSTFDNSLSLQMMLECDRRILYNEVILVDPKIIVSLGNVVWNFLRGYHGYEVFKIWHPSYVKIYGMSKMNNYRMQVKKVFDRMRIIMEESK